MQNLKIPSFMETSRAFLEFRILPWNWSVLTNFKIQGIFSTQFQSRNLIFNAEFENYIIPGNFQKFPGTLDIALERIFDFSFLVTLVFFKASKNQLKLSGGTFQNYFNVQRRGVPTHYQKVLHLLQNTHGCLGVKRNHHNLLLGTQQSSVEGKPS